MKVYKLSFDTIWPWALKGKGPETEGLNFPVISAKKLQAGNKLKQASKAGKQNDELVTWEFLLNMQQNFLVERKTRNFSRAKKKNEREG